MGTETRRDEIERVFNQYGVTGEIHEAVPVGSEERVFVLTTDQAARMNEHALTQALVQLLHCKVWITTDGPAWAGRTRPL